MRTKSRNRVSLSIAGISLALLSLSACGGQSPTQEAAPLASVQPTASVNREAGLYRDARLCITNNTSEKLFLSPGDDTIGQSMTQKPGKQNCFDSNDTAKTNATVLIEHSDGEQYLVGAENFMIKPPKIYTCTPFEASGNTCGSRVIPLAKLDEQVLTLDNPKGSEIKAGAHTYVPTRQSDADYFIVIQLDVNQ